MIRIVPDKDKIKNPFKWIDTNTFILNPHDRMEAQIKREVIVESNRHTVFNMAVDAVYSASREVTAEDIQKIINGFEYPQGITGEYILKKLEGK